MSIHIKTERLILRQFTSGDCIELHRICTQPYILQWMPDWNCTIEERKGWIKWVGKQYETATKETARIMLAITLKSTGELIGMIGIGNKEEVDNEIEITYFISQDFCNQGYMSEAVNAMVEWAFETLNLEYLIAIVELDNYPSQKVVEKCCFTKIDTRMILNSGDTEEKPFYYYRMNNNISI